MGRLTRRQVLLAAWGTGVLFTGGLLAACGQPRSTATTGAARPAIAGTSAASTPVIITPQVTVYPPLPTRDATVILPTVVLPPNHQTVTLKPTVANVPPQPPVPTPRPEDPHCSTVRETRIAQPAAYTQISTLVVIATITTIHPPRWSTQDGQRPANPHDPQSGARIYTLVEAQVEQALKGTAPSSAMIVTPVGTIGADCALAPDSNYTFTTSGERVVLFLGLPLSEPKQLNGVSLWRLYERYTITSVGTATNQNQTLPLLELVSIVMAAASTPASPTPVPPGTPVPAGTP